MNNVIKTANTLLHTYLDVFVFVFLAVWSAAAAYRMDLSAQDGWLLDHLWVQFALLVGSYLVIVSRRSDLRLITLVTFGLTWLLYALPALKYTFTYASTTDVATHLALMSSIASTGELVSTNVYSSTPGFHALNAIFAQLSGLKIETVGKIIPGFLGSFLPLCLYAISKRSQMPEDLAKWVIAVSSLSLPNLYGLNGTSFTVPIFFCLLAFVMLRLITPDKNGVEYTLVIFVFTVQIIFWHPSTSFVYPIFFICVGLFGILFPRVALLPRQVRDFFSVGVIAVVGSFSYWMYGAHYVWSLFLKNFAALADLEKESSALIPARLFQITFSDQIAVALLYHARDGLLIGLALLGLVFLVGEKKKRAPFVTSIGLLGVIFLVTLAFIAVVFIVNFGAQGYRRFLVYAVILTPILAGYALWRAGKVISARFRVKSTLLFPLLLALVTVVSFVEIYPYQNLVPNAKTSAYDPRLSPMIWLHQVNTSYQYQMIQYALTHLLIGDQILSDYVGSHQAKIFFGVEAAKNVRSWLTPKPEAALILLHWPGEAGGYQDKIEIRSMDRIAALRDYAGMSQVYDNGYSFILYFPENVQALGIK